MDYELKIFERVIYGDLSPFLKEEKEPSKYTTSLMTKYCSCYDVVVGTFQKKNSKFILQEKTVFNFLHPQAAIYDNPQKDLFKKANISSLNPETIAALNVDVSKIGDISFSHQPNKSIICIRVISSWNTITYEESKYLYYYDLFSSEIRRIIEWVHQALYSYKSNNEIEHYIHILQNSLINMCLGVLKLLNEKQQSEIYNPSIDFTDVDIINQCYIALEKLLRFLEKNFFQYINQNIRIPYRSALLKVNNTNEKLDLVKSTFLRANIDPALLKIIYLPLLNFSTLNIADRLTYKQLTYSNTYLNAFYEKIKDTPGQITDEIIKEVLYRVNFNSSELHRFKTQIIKNNLLKIEEICDKIEYLYFYLKIINQRTCKVNIMYDKDLPSIKDQLITWLEEEINYYNKKLDLSSKNQPSNLFSENTKLKMQSNLSVAQLAFFFKLISQAGIITNKVQRDIFRHISDNYQTSKVTEISQESIRSKFYNIESSTIEIIKEKTIDMLNLLKIQ